MAEAPYTGLTACLKVGSGEAAKVVAYISGFNLSVSRDIIEILAFGKQYKEKVASIKDWSASIDGTVAFEAGGTQATLIDAFESGEALTFGMYLNDTTYFEGQGLVSGYEIDAAPDDKITLSSEVAGTGGVALNMGKAN